MTLIRYNWKVWPVALSFWLAVPGSVTAEGRKPIVNSPPQPNPTLSQQAYLEATHVLNGVFVDRPDSPTLEQIFRDHDDRVRHFELFGESDPVFNPTNPFYEEKAIISGYLAKGSQESLNSRLQEKSETVRKLSQGLKLDIDLSGKNSSSSNAPVYGLVVQRITPQTGPADAKDGDNGQQLLVERKTNVIWTIAPIERYSVAPTQDMTWETPYNGESSSFQFEHPWWQRPPSPRFSARVVPKNLIGLGNTIPGARIEAYQVERAYRFVYETGNKAGEKATSEHICEVPVTQNVSAGEVLDERFKAKRTTLGTEIYGATSRLHYQHDAKLYVAEMIKQYRSWKVGVNLDSLLGGSRLLTPVNLGFSLHGEF